MESHEKPYLILQLDETFFKCGYETRIEAAVRSFRNHYSVHKSRQDKGAVIYAPPLIPAKKNHFMDKTLLIPNWDNISLPLIIANLKSEGIDARLLERRKRAFKKACGSTAASVSRSTSLPRNLLIMWKSMVLIRRTPYYG